MFLKSDKISKHFAAFAEAALTLVLFSSVIYFLTWAPGRIWKLLLSAGIIFAGILISLKCSNLDRRRLWAVISALASGFWLYTFFRYLGFVRWPMGYASRISEYFFQFVSHAVLVLFGIAPLLWVCRRAFLKEVFSWGDWNRVLRNGNAGFSILSGAVAGVFIWAFYRVFTNPLQGVGSVYLFFLLALGKAVLTGTGEEIAYRGFIQKAAVYRFGPITGIILQALLYTAFHVNLGQAFFKYYGFIAGVFGLGIFLGVVCYKTRGLGWAILIHTAIDLVIEWRNLL